MKKNWTDFLNFSRFIVKRFNQDRCVQVAASLTFTTLLSLVPLITIALTVFSAFPVFDDFSIQIKTYLLNNLMPNVAGKIITKYMHQFTESAMNLTTAGVMFLAVMAMLMMLTIDHAFNTIWGVARQRPLIKRLVIYWAVLTLGPLLIGASLSLTSWLVGLSMGYARSIPIFGVGVLKALPVLFNTVAFAMLFRLLPNRHVPFENALIGAIVAAAVFESMNHVFGYYIKNFASYKLVYGAFASVPIFLLWIYLSWMATLFGAVIAASLSHWRAPEARHLSPAEQLLDALHVLQIMAKGLQQGRVSIFTELSRSLYLDYDTLDNILDKLEGADMVRKTGRNGWLLMRHTNRILASELLSLFVLGRDSMPIGQNDDPLQQWILACADQLEQNADVTLQELFARSAA